MRGNLLLRVSQLFLLTGMLITGSPGLYAADIEAGKRIATRWCSSCHAVAPNQAMVIAAVPSFASISGKRRISEISGYLVQSHTQMPDMSLTQDEISNLIAYIQSLAPPLDPQKPAPQKDKPPKEYRG